MAIEPSTFRPPAPSNAYQNRGKWNWWYSAIADWMIRNPGGKLGDCAAELKKHQNTISMIVNTDMFREYFTRRKQEWQESHDFAIRSKVTAVAEQSLDLLLEKMEKRRDQIPMNLVTEVATSALDRLGYGPKAAPAVAVSVSQTDNRVQIAVDARSLTEAREAMRLAEERRAIEARQIEETRSEAPTNTLEAQSFDVADDLPS